MYAVIKAGGKQYRVEEGMTISIDLLDQEEGSAFETDQIILLKDASNKITIGSPTVQGAKVQGKVLSHFKDKKVVVFKKKRRKGYRRTQGHRQNYTKIQIEKIEN